MGDPDPEHAERLSWLSDVVGVGQFDPAALDKKAVNAALATLPVAGARG